MFDWFLNTSVAYMKSIACNSFDREFWNQNKTFLDFSQYLQAEFKQLQIGKELQFYLNYNFI